MAMEKLQAQLARIESKLDQVLDMLQPMEGEEFDDHGVFKTYDSLSADQVIEKSLTWSTDLRAIVLEYETAHKNRKSVVTALTDDGQNV